MENGSLNQAAPAGADQPRLVNLVANPPEAAKRGRGRPKGSVAGPVNPAPAAANPAPMAPSIWNLENTGALVRLPFAAGAVITGCEGLALNPAEENALTPAALEVLKQFAPAAGAQYASIIALTGALIAVGSAKAPIWTAHVKAKRAEAAAKAAQAEKKDTPLT